MKQRSALLNFLLGICPGIPSLMLFLFNIGQGSCSSILSPLFFIAWGVYLLEVFVMLFLLFWKKSVSNPFLMGIMGVFLLNLLSGGLLYLLHNFCFTSHWPGLF